MIMHLKQINRVIVLSAALAAVPWLAEAHHSGAAYDGSKVMRIDGEVERWQFANPHSSLQIRVTDSSGEQQIWSFEGLPAGMLAPRGYRRNTFTPDEKITVVYNPMRNGSGGGGRLVGAVLPDGSTIGEVSAE
jgi:hypothetical protein